MRALVLAAGFGTRLRPITETTPKCLVPIHGRPLLDYWFALLLSGGIERILINTHYLSERVQAHLADSPWRDRVDSVHETELLGTGGTVLRNAPWFGPGPFLVAHGDNLARFDVAAFMGHHRDRPSGIEITMMTFETDRPQSCGIVEQDDQGIVQAFHEKVPDPPGNRANAAVYIFEPSVLPFLSATGKDVIDISTDVLPHFLGKIRTFHNSDYLRDIGTVESLQKAHAETAGWVGAERLPAKET